MATKGFRIRDLQLNAQCNGCGECFVSDPVVSALDPDGGRKLIAQLFAGGWTVFPDPIFHRVFCPACAAEAPATEDAEPLKVEPAVDAEGVDILDDAAFVAKAAQAYDNPHGLAVSEIAQLGGAVLRRVAPLADGKKRCFLPPFEAADVVGWQEVVRGGRFPQAASVHRMSVHGGWLYQVTVFHRESPTGRRIQATLPVVFVPEAHIVDGD